MLFSRKRVAQAALLITTAFAGTAQADGLTQTLTIEAGPIWNQQDAERKCPNIAASANGTWTGQWWTTVQGRMSVCQVKVKQRRSPEQRCYDKVDGKVAWNRNGDTNWQAKNIKRLCHNVTKPRRRIRCFKQGISAHNDWQRAIVDCGGKAAPRTARSAAEICFDKIQGKVAWNNNGNTRWNPTNVKRVCRGVSNPTNRVNCFKRQMNRHGDWQRAADHCNGSRPTPRTAEERCFDKVQNKVAWNRAGQTSWSPANVRTLCDGVGNIDRRIACFKRGINKHNKWARASADCKRDVNAYTPRYTSAERRCYNKVQNRVAWNQEGNTRWSDTNVRTLCSGVNNVDRRIACFKRGINKHNKWARASADCKRDVNAYTPRYTSAERRCYNKVQNRVAWNQAGNTRWSETNVRTLCSGVNNVDRRIACFKRGINKHNKWARASADCKRDVNAYRPRHTSAERRCYNKVQNRVAWNQEGNTRWSDTNVRTLCNGVNNVDRRIACFKRGINKHNKWRQATADCKRNANAYPVASSSQTIGERACYNRVQGNVAWNRAGNTSWVKANAVSLCDGVRVRSVNRRIACFKRGIAAHNKWQRATRDCKNDDTAYTSSGTSIGIDSNINIGGGLLGGGSSSNSHVADVEAGPIWDNNDAKTKCRDLAARVGGTWTGQWRTTVSGRMSVCSIKFRN